MIQCNRKEQNSPTWIKDPSCVRVSLFPIEAAVQKVRSYNIYYPMLLRLQHGPMISYILTKGKALYFSSRFWYHL